MPSVGLINFPMRHRERRTYQTLVLQVLTGDEVVLCNRLQLRLPKGPQVMIKSNHISVLYKLVQSTAMHTRDKLSAHNFLENGATNSQKGYSSFIYRTKAMALSWTHHVPIERRHFVNLLQILACFHLGTPRTEKAGEVSSKDTCLSHVNIQALADPCELLVWALFTKITDWENYCWKQDKRWRTAYEVGFGSL